MNANRAKAIIQQLLSSADIIINGSRPEDLIVHNNQFYSRVLKEGSLGLGEAYMEKWWDCHALDLFFEKILRAQLDTKIKKNARLLFSIFLAKIFNFQTKRRALEVGRKHYDLSPTLFQAMLDSKMTYTCGYWKSATTLEEAQTHKLKLTCDKLYLQPGMRVLDVGCGWGGLARYAAENYGVEVVGVTISEEQQSYAKKYCQGLPIEIRFQDYRDVTEKFDRIVSLGMFEHVGYKNYFDYMHTLHQALKPEGIFLLHTIGVNKDELPNEWITQYIFPNGMLPSIKLISKASEPFFVMEDWHNFGIYYDPTLMAWQKNFASKWDSLKLDYDDKFYRMWNYYLLSCAGAFRARSMHLWQIVFSKEGLTGGYQSIR